MDKNSVKLGETMNMKARNIDFVCVGFPKCGTTTLYGVLKQHPQISLDRGNETTFFNSKEDFGSIYSNNLTFYKVLGSSYVYGN